MANEDYYGSDLKFLVEPSASGFVKERDNFDVTISRGNIERTWEKSELSMDVEGNYYVCFSTEDFGAGQYYMTVVTHTPDDDFDDGFRDEIDQIALINVKKPKK